MSGQKIGYMRVSTVDQKTDRQLDGVELNRVFEDKASGKDKNRPQLKECLNYCRSGDSLYIHSIDRLARNTQDLLEIVAGLREKGVTVIFVKEGLTLKDSADHISDMILTIIGSIAQFVRALTREAQLEGIAKAKLKGIYKGGAPLSDYKINAIKEMSSEGRKSVDIASSLDVSISTVYKYKEGNKSE